MQVFPNRQKNTAGVVIGLTLDEMVFLLLLKTAIRLLKKIINKAASYGITKENIIIDCLVLTVSAQQKRSYGNGQSSCNGQRIRC